MEGDQLERAQKLVGLAERLDATPSQVALAWCLRLPEISSAIIGARDLKQLEENAAAADLELDEATLAELEAVFPGPVERDTTT